MRQALEGRHPVQLGGDGQLEVMAGDGLVVGDRGRLVAVLVARLGGVDEVGAGAGAVVGRREVVGHRHVGGDGGRDGGDVARRPREPPEPLPHGIGGGGQVAAGVAHDLVAGGVAQGGVGPQPGEDLGHVGGAEQAAADLGVLAGQAVELVEADAVDLGRGDVVETRGTGGVPLIRAA